MEVLHTYEALRRTRERIAAAEERGEPVALAEYDGLADLERQVADDLAAIISAEREVLADPVVKRLLWRWHDPETELTFGWDGRGRTVVVYDGILEVDRVTVREPTVAEVLRRIGEYVRGVTG